MKKKTLTALLLSLMTTFFISGISACTSTNSNTSNESSLESTQEESSLESVNSSMEESSNSPSSSSTESSEDSEENSSTDTPPDISEDPILLDEGDYAGTDYTKTVIVADYNTHSTLSLQTEVVSENSNSALKGIFHKKDANSVYTDEGGEWVWSLLTFDLTKIYGSLTDLNNATFTFDVKTENCERNIRLAMLYDANEYRAKEYNLGYPLSGMNTQSLSNGWTRLTISLSILYTQHDLTDVAGIVLLFGNPNCNEDENSVYYLDNATLSFTQPTPYPSNRAGYYSKDEHLSIYLYGNSFVHYSASTFWFNEIADLNDANVMMSYFWVPNGTILDHYNNAFGTNGYFTSEDGWAPDIIFMQDFYSPDDTAMFGEYLDTFYAYNPEAEIKIYAAENETNDGLAASLLYGVDHVNWKSLIKTLKSDYGYTATNLNDAHDGWHPNEISGLAGAVLLYMEVYGEIPDVSSLAEAALKRNDFYGTPIKNYLPGATDEAKKLEIEKIVKLAATLYGLEWKETCWHSYKWTTREATCYDGGLSTGVCTNCKYKTYLSINPTGHQFVNGSCKNCNVTENTPDPNDYANLNYVSNITLGQWNVDATLTLQSEVVTPLKKTSSALKATFNKQNSDVYTGEGGEWVWTVLAFDVKKMHRSSDLTDTTFILNIKAQNCSYVGSITVVDRNGNALSEIPYNVMADNEESKPGIRKKVENDGWITVYFSLSEIFPDADLTQSKQICLIFSNAFSDESQDSIVYLDNATLY